MDKLLLILLVATLSQAHASTPTTAMSCSEAYSAVLREGHERFAKRGIVVDFFAHEGLCTWNESAEPAWVPTRDEPNCFIGYECVDSPDAR